MKRPVILLLPIYTALAGCAASYVPPTSAAASARLRVVQVANDNTTVQKLKNACLVTSQNARFFGRHYEKISNFSGISGASDLRRLNMADPPQAPVKFTEITVDASQPFVLGYDATRMVPGYPQGMVYSCVNALSFQPQPGADYEAVIIWRPNDSCGLELRRLVTSGGKTIREAVDSVRLVQEECQ